MMLLLSCSCPSLALAVAVAVTVSIDDATDFHLPGPPTVQRGEFYKWKSRSRVRGLSHEQALRFRCFTMLFSNEGSAFNDV